MATSLVAKSSNLADGFASQTEPAVFDLSVELQGLTLTNDSCEVVCSTVIFSPLPNLTKWKLLTHFRTGLIQDRLLNHLTYLLPRAVTRTPQRYLCKQHHFLFSSMLN